MLIELNDAEIVRQIGTGSSREAEAELFRRMAPRLRLYGLRRLLAFDESGIERLAGEYMFHHMRTMPGPGA
jgi:hypothetical protein